MRKIIFAIIAISFIACSKDESKPVVTNSANPLDGVFKMDSAFIKKGIYGRIYISINLNSNYFAKNDSWIDSSTNENSTSIVTYQIFRYTSDTLYLVKDNYYYHCYYYFTNNNNTLNIPTIITRPINRMIN